MEMDLRHDLHFKKQKFYGTCLTVAGVVFSMCMHELFHCSC